MTCCGRPNYEKHRAGRKHRHRAAAAAATSAAIAACGTLHGAPARECDADALLAGLLARGRDSAQVLLLGPDLAQGALSCSQRPCQEGSPRGVGRFEQGQGEAHCCGFEVQHQCMHALQPGRVHSSMHAPALLANYWNGGSHADLLTTPHTTGHMSAARAQVGLPLPAACANAQPGELPQQAALPPPGGLCGSAFQLLASLPLSDEEPPAGAGAPLKQPLRPSATAPSALVGLCGADTVQGFSLEPRGSGPAGFACELPAHAHDSDNALASLRARAATCLLPSCTQGVPQAQCARAWPGAEGSAAAFGGLMESMRGRSAPLPAGLQGPQAHAWQGAGLLADALTWLAPAAPSQHPGQGFRGQRAGSPAQVLRRGGSTGCELPAVHGRAAWGTPSPAPPPQWPAWPAGT